jgi:hypothetical protein
MKRLVILGFIVLVTLLTVCSCNEHVCPAYADTATEQSCQANT